jgi:hypothetical protein
VGVESHSLDDSTGPTTIGGLLVSSVDVLRRDQHAFGVPERPHTTAIPHEPQWRAGHMQSGGSIRLNGRGEFNSIARS